MNSNKTFDFNLSLKNYLIENTLLLFKNHQLPYDWLLKMSEQNRCNLYYETMITLLCEYPQGFDIKQINQAILNLLFLTNQNNQEIEWTSLRGKTLVTLIRTSRNLKQAVSGSLMQDEISPFDFAMKQPSSELIQIMLNNNFILWEEVKHNQERAKHDLFSSVFTSKKEKQLIDLFNSLSLTRFFQGLNIWQLYILGLTDKNCKLNCLPSDILTHIINIAITPLDFTVDEINFYEDYCKKNTKLFPQMIAFKKYYSILNNHNHRYGGLFSINFCDKNSHFSPFSFFAQAQEFKDDYGIRDEDDPHKLTTQALKISTQYPNINSQNEDLVTKLFYTICSNKTRTDHFFYAILSHENMLKKNEEIMEGIRKQLHR